VYGSYGDDSPYLRPTSRSGAPSLAGSSPFRKAYQDQLESQYDMTRRIGEWKARLKAARHGVGPVNPYASQSFEDGFVSRLASQSPQLASGLRGLFGGSSSSSFSSNIPWDFNTGLNFLPSGSSGASTNFSNAGISGPDFATTTLDFFR